MTFDNLESLFQHLETQIQDVMQHEVADTAKEIVRDAVQEDVYDVFTPKVYTRRMENGGMSDMDNYSVEAIKNGIAIRNDTPLDNGRDTPRLDEIVVYGKGRMPFPRDYYSSGTRMLEKSGAHVSALKKWLKDCGIDVK